MPDAPTTAPPTASLALARPHVRAFRIDVIRGPDAGAGLRSEGRRVVVGSHRTADLVLADPTVSRFHCELAIDGDAVRLVDLGSSNRTVIDTVEVDAARLRGPTIVTVGRTELRVDLLADTVEVELSAGERFGPLVGASPAMRAAFAQLARAAARDEHLLIEGEIGTGKDAAAAAVHEASRRAGGPLDVVDAGGPGLEVEAALFGNRDRAGALERCAGGTVVIDDLGALPRGAQRALVRALETRTVRRIGRDDDVPLDVRVIALSRRDPRVDVNRDLLRADLYDTLAVLYVRLPPLRDRPEDLPLLVAHFVDALGATGAPAAAALLAADAIARLRAAPWPGNVRELRAHVERAVAGADLPAGAASDADDALPLIDPAVPLRDARRRWIRHFERAYLTELLARTGGNVTAAAARAGVDRVHLHRLLAACGLRTRG